MIPSNTQILDINSFWTAKANVIVVLQLWKGGCSAPRDIGWLWRVIPPGRWDAHWWLGSRSNTTNMHQPRLWSSSLGPMVSPPLAHGSTFQGRIGPTGCPKKKPVPDASHTMRRWNLPRIAEYSRRRSGRCLANHIERYCQIQTRHTCMLHTSTSKKNEIEWDMISHWILGYPSFRQTYVRVMFNTVRNRTFTAPCGKSCGKSCGHLFPL